jgi:diguanylate cyclase (GGDEF)-like protein
MVQSRTDSSGAFVIALAAGPMVLPVLGVHVADLIFALPLITCVWAAIAAFSASRRCPERRLGWLWFSGACAVAALASVFGIVGKVTGGGATAALYVGLIASGCLVVAGGTMAGRALRAKGWSALVDPLLLAGVGASIVVYQLVLPGFEHGDAILTGALVTDVAAMVLTVAAAAGTASRPVKAWLIIGLAAVCGGDGIAAGSASGASFLSESFTPVLWAIAAACLAVAAGRDREQEASDEVVDISRRAAYVQVLLPLGAIIGYPVTVGVLALLHHRHWLGPVAFFGPLFLASTTIAFARQAVLLVEQRRAAVRERRLSVEAMRRNRELEALTGLATTMTEVLEERPVMERGLEALRVAARTSSSALHLIDDEGRADLVATTGDWGADREWARFPAQPPAAAQLERRGRRHIARVPIAARGRVIGLLTLVRPEAEGAFDGELNLLGLLADQLAVALQNSRDYHEKLEAAIRDPLTGLYNRRYFYEAFSQEIARHERYGTPAALVLFDIDDFKQINDTLGHQAGDEVLEEVGKIVARLVRPSDTFARIGGEEFGLLMPETGQLDALLVAERLRTAVARTRILGERPVTLSGGVAAMPQDGTTREELQSNADQALYWAKRNGKNMCAVASEALAADTETGQEGMLAHLHAVVAGIDAAHLHTRDHSENVASYAVAIGQALSLDPERIVRIRRAAFLHDIGKVAVADDILGKPAGLTDEEFEAIKLHPQVGETMLHHAGLHAEARWVGAHHERLDGKGYPQGLAAEEIPFEARILFVADSFEAMTSDRPYRKGMPIPDAIAELRRCAGTQFDPVIVNTLANLVEHDRLAVLALKDEV